MNIKSDDLVLEIGPGAFPYWRSDCLADKFDPGDETVDIKQFGGRKMKLSGKPLFKIENNRLPFKDSSFDYIICTHVLEHVPYEELGALINEMNRVAKRKYIEFPTVPYDYFYDFNVHVNLMDIVEDKIICLPKEFSGIDKVKVYTQFMFNLRMIQGLGIEKSKYWLFATGKEYSSDIKFEIVKSPEEFFSRLNIKYSQKLSSCKPDYPFLFLEKVRKTLRKLKKESSKERFESLLI